MNKPILNNEIKLLGTILTKPTYSHEVSEEKFYTFFLSTRRKSNIFDIIPITINKRLMEEQALDIGNKVFIQGQFRSKNLMVDGKSKLLLTAFAKTIEEAPLPDDINTIELVGTICKPPIYRITPLKREIADVLIATNRTYNKSDYIPCIAWEGNARLVSGLKVGDTITIKGRIQSRKYNKEINGEMQEKTAYEISINDIQII